MDALRPVPALIAVPALAASLPDSPVEGDVLARLAGGGMRLSLAGVLIDVMADVGAAPGDRARLTTATEAGRRVVVIDILPRPSGIVATLPSTAAPLTSGLAPPPTSASGVPATTERGPGADAGAAPTVASGPPAEARVAASTTGLVTRHILMPDDVRLATPARPMLGPTELVRPDGVLPHAGASGSAGASPVDPVDLSEAAWRLLASGTPLSAQQADPAERLTPAQRAAVSAMIPQAAARQGGLGPLIEEARALIASPAIDRLPEPAIVALRQLAARPLDPLRLDSVTLQQAIASAGPFFEAALVARGSAQPAMSGPNDTKALVLMVRNALASLAGADIAAATVERPPLPRRGAPPSGQKPADGLAPEPRDPLSAARQIVERAEQALDRIRLVQAASLPEDRDEADGVRPPVLAEVPVALADGRVGMMGLSVGRDGRASGEPGEPSGWLLKLSLDLGEAGALDGRIALRSDEITVTLFAAETPTAAALELALPALRQALAAAALPVERLEIRAGRAPATVTPRAGAFLDRRT